LARDNRENAVRKLLIAIGLLVAVLPVQSSSPPRARHPLVRIRVVVTTEARAADLSLDTGSIVNMSVRSGDRGLRVRGEHNRLSFTRESARTSEAHVSLIASDITDGTAVRWHLTLRPSAAPTDIEIYNENDASRPRLVDRFHTDHQEDIFETPVGSLLAGGPVSPGVWPPPLTLAFYYPWYLHADWNSSRLRDEALFQYSTEFPDEIARSLTDARDAGLNGVIVSWRGDTDWNDRRLRYLLDDAQRLGLKVSILVETLWATEGPEGTVKPLNADKMRRWIEKAFDVFASHPAFLNTNGRPVVFVYLADAFTLDDWRAIAASLRQSRRNVLLVGDTVDLRYLESFGGLFTYATVGIPQVALEPFHRDQALRTQSFHLLSGGERRVYAATVSPGYDDTLLVDRETTFSVDRANGRYFDAQWSAAVAAQPDWIVVTSWNEFWENTHIEPSVRYGHQYQVLTRRWSTLFRRSFLP
jgi:glycosyl hydrolase family 99